MESSTDIVIVLGTVLGTVLGGWPALVPLLVVWAGMAGWLARGAGLANIFRDDDHILYETDERCRLPRSVPAAERRRRPFLRVLQASPAFWSHGGLAILGAVSWVAMRAPVACPAACGGGTPPPGALPGAAEVMLAGLVAGGLGLLCAGVSLRRDRLDIAPPEPQERRAELLRCGLGVLGGTAALFAMQTIAEGLATGDGWRGSPATWLNLQVLVLVVLALGVPFLVPSLALIALLGLLTVLGGFAGMLAGVWGQVAVLIVAGLVVWANGRPYKAQIPGMDYASVRATSGDEEARSITSNPEKLPPVTALSAWHARNGAQKPLLVLLATSGGAYRASFWTALVLDRIAAESAPGQRFAGLPANLRLIAGASGGMVAGAYFAALTAREGRPPARLLDAITADTIAAQSGTSPRGIPIPRDSLAAVVQHWLRRDLPATLVPGITPRDRGVVLDEQWPTLAAPFAEIGRSEADGIAPSLVLTPMLVETGAVAYFSNLDLCPMRQERLRPRMLAENIDRDSVEVFDVFPAARHSLTLATAVRLNATFPYVSPAVSLPTIPPRRVVDAGYWDNFGGDVIAGWLATPDVMRWVCEHCAGVAILQVRAFAQDQAEPRPTARPAVALQGVTSPAEGLLSARASSQIVRNNAQIRLIEQLYESALSDLSGQPATAGRCWPFIRRFTFEAYADTTMSWYLPGREVAALGRLLPPADDFYPEHFAMPDAGPSERLTRRREDIAATLDQLAAFAAEARALG